MKFEQFMDGLSELCSIGKFKISNSIAELLGDNHIKMYNDFIRDHEYQKAISLCRIKILEEVEESNQQLIDYGEPYGRYTEHNIATKVSKEWKKRLDNIFEEMYNDLMKELKYQEAISLCHKKVLEEVEEENQKLISYGEPYGRYTEHNIATKVSKEWKKKLEFARNKFNNNN